MSLNLIDQFKGLLTDAVLEKVTSSIGGGDSSSIQKGLMSAGGSILAAAMGKASSKEGAEGLFNMLGDGSALSNIGEQLGNNSSFLESGADLAKNLLGDKANKVLNLIGEESGLDAGSSGTLLSLGSGLIGGLLGQQKAAGGTVASLTSLLSDQGSLLDKAMPALGGLLGLGSLTGLTSKLADVKNALGGLGDVAANVTGDIGDAVGHVSNKVGDGVGSVANATVDAGSAAIGGGKSLLSKLLPLIILALLGIGLFGLLKSCNPAEKVGDMATGAAQMAEGAVDAASDAAGAVVDTTADVANNVAEGAADTLGAAADATTDAAGAVVDATANVANGAADTLGAAADATTDAAGAVVDGATDAAASAAGVVSSAVNAFGDAIGKLFSFDLPNGEKISIPEGGFEDSFLNALKDGGLSENKFYVFDRLFFASGSSALNAESDNQIANASKILKAYPNLRILLRGHTDSQGDAAANQTLSESRAAAVKTAIVAQGIDASRILTKGLASTEPLMDNDTAENRQRNRRIDVSVIQ